MSIRIALAIFCGAVVVQAETRVIPLQSLDGWKLVRIKAESVTFKGRHAIRLTEGAGANDDAQAILTSANFQDGVIEIDLAGEPSANAVATARGFVGISFRTDPDASKYECFYIRPTNGRADDQVRRNHSLQYVSAPEFPWQRLRKETPEKYESYADLVPGEWTKLKIEVHGAKANLYINGALQPNLLVHDLKLGSRSGGIGLWIGPGTIGHFSNLRVTPE